MCSVGPGGLVWLPRAQPPFPFAPFAARLLRFIVIGVLALGFGKRILKWADNPIVQDLLIGLVVLCMVGSIVSVIGWISAFDSTAKRPERLGGESKQVEAAKGSGWAGSDGSAPVEERNEPDHQEDEEQDLGDSSRRARDSGETENRRDNRNDKKYKRPVKHVIYLELRCADAGPKCCAKVHGWGGPEMDLRNSAR
jgi:hypothetical protein